MLRACSSHFFESSALELITTACKNRGCRTYARSSSAHQTVLVSEAPRNATAAPASKPVQMDQQTWPAPPTPPSPPSPPSSPSPPSPPTRRTWTIAAAAFAVTASLGGLFFYRKQNEKQKHSSLEIKDAVKKYRKQDDEEEWGILYPASGSSLPEHVSFLIVGAGTAAFAALRAIRAARPDASVLLVGEERVLPYMRPPLSKELWREPDLVEKLKDPHLLTFKQWNGKKRSVTYEPPVFYTPVEKMAQGEVGAGVARGWRAVAMDVVGHRVTLAAPGQSPVSIGYEKCLIATGVQPARLEVLSRCANAGRSMALRGLRDVARLAMLLQRDDVRSVVIIGGGFLATELSSSLAHALKDKGKIVTQIYREPAPLSHILPPYLADEAARRVAEAGVTLIPNSEVVSAEMSRRGTVEMRTLEGESISGDVVVECVGVRVEDEWLARAGLERHPTAGGLSLTAELQARADVYAAGDIACFIDSTGSRRRVEHHDHAVASGRHAGNNMVAASLQQPQLPYTHQPMLWSDLQPQCSLEAIGIIDSKLQTVGVFSEDAVVDESAITKQKAIGLSDAVTENNQVLSQTSSQRKRYERGVVFYLKEKRVVGVLLWNLFNRLHIARQVLAQGEFEDLFEVAKLFSPHEED